MGLDLQLAARFRFEDTSQREWQKHLAITGLYRPGGGIPVQRSTMPTSSGGEIDPRLHLHDQEGSFRARWEMRHLNIEADAKRWSLLLPEDVLADEDRSKKRTTSLCLPRLEIRTR